jgi:RNA polymerase sigma factor (sigma-70 family)
MGEADLQQLIEDCIQQDRKSQKMLYKAFYGFAMGICLRYANNRYEATEIMNQGFLKVFTNLHRYDDGRPFKAWMGKIMMNTSIDYYRSNLRMAYTDDLEKAEHVYDNNELPDKRIAYNELIAMIQQLPQAYRTVFNLYAIEGYTHEEIGTMLNINAGTSKSNLFKAREKLKKMILKAAEIPDGINGTSQTQIVAINAAHLHLSFLNNGIRR